MICHHVNSKYYCIHVPCTQMDMTRYLFLEVANGILISIGEEVEDFMLYVIFL